jgi:hypothetical protein
MTSGTASATGTMSPLAMSCPCASSGPHSIASLATEWRAYLFTMWGGTHRPGMDMAGFGFTEEFAGHENDP